MSNTTRLGFSLALALSLAPLTGCMATSHDVVTATLGTPSSASAMEAALAEPGPVTVETVVGADWSVPRSGVLNLDNPKAKAAKLEDRDEPVQIMFHALHHPTRGLYLVDTGVERALRDDPDHAVIRGIVASVAHTDRMTFHDDTATWLSHQPEPLAGVFLTHLHLDHVSGMRDVPNAAAIYEGPGDARDRSFQNLFVKGVLNEALEGKGPVQEWAFSRDPDGVFDGVLDVFGDRSVFAIWVPGHTPGSTAYLVRSPRGPVLLTGDACHTTWGWENGVEPGSFSDDEKESAHSLDRLEALVARHPQIDVRLGHQQRTAKAVASATSRP